MAIKTINDTHLTSIANAIREKNGLETQYLPSEMAAAISAIEASGGGLKPLELNLNDDVSYAFRESCKEIFENNFISKINVSVIKESPTSKNAKYFLSNTTITEEALPPINIDIWCYNQSSLDCSYFFINNQKIRNYNKVTLTERTFNGYCTFNSMFRNNYYLKEAPTWVRQIVLKHPYSSSSPSDYAYNQLYYYCYSLDKAILPVGYYATNNILKNIFKNNFHLGSIKFATEEDGTPIDITWVWKNQLLDLSTTDAHIGYSNTDNFTSWDTERFTTTKKVTDLTSYEELKDNPDWWSSDVNFSRYNHDSAVETINSLPNVAAKEGNTNNIIKFQGIMGSGYNKAINTLTEEEIAVAAAKGWTVTLV